MNHFPAPHRTVLTGLAALLGALPVTALAGHNDALISVQNRFDGEAEVYVDGRFQGMVAGDATATFDVRAGGHNVRVQRPATAYVLASLNLNAPCGATTLVRVDPPRETLRVTNVGEVSLKLQTEGAAAVWVNPNATAVLSVAAGNVALHASIRDPRGEWEAMSRSLWVEPGRPAGTTLKPDPTVLVITNQDRFPVHALVDGADIGWIDPGTSQRTWIRPGSADVVLLDRQGRVQYTTSVYVRKGNDARVVFVPPSRPAVVINATLPTVVWDWSRPRGYHEPPPGRGWYDHRGYDGRGYDGRGYDRDDHRGDDHHGDDHHGDDHHGDDRPAPPPRR